MKFCAIYPFLVITVAIVGCSTRFVPRDIYHLKIRINQEIAMDNEIIVLKDSLQILYSKDLLLFDFDKKKKLQINKHPDQDNFTTILSEMNYSCIGFNRHLKYGFIIGNDNLVSPVDIILILEARGISDNLIYMMIENKLSSYVEVKQPFLSHINYEKTLAGRNHEVYFLKIRNLLRANEKMRGPGIL